ncbi:hypothetical protein R6Q59_009839 [Mikania micrantha]
MLAMSYKKCKTGGIEGSGLGWPKKAYVAQVFAEQCWRLEKKIWFLMSAGQYYILHGFADMVKLQDDDDLTRGCINSTTSLSLSQLWCVVS